MKILHFHRVYLCIILWQRNNTSFFLYFFFMSNCICWLESLANNMKRIKNIWNSCQLFTIRVSISVWQQVDINKHNTLGARLYFFLDFFFCMLLLSVRFIVLFARAWKLPFFLFCVWWWFLSFRFDSGFFFLAFTFYDSCAC